MKKILISSILTILILIFAGCQDNSENSNNAENNFVEPMPEYVANDLDDLILYWSQTRSDSNGSGSENSLTVPVLRSELFRFSQAVVTEYNYEYYYVPTDYEKTYFDYNLGIVILVSREDNSFEAVVDQYDLPPESDTVCHSSTNTWYINNDGIRIGIDFPQTIVIENAEDLKDYFIFEKRTATTDNDYIIPLPAEYEYKASLIEAKYKEDGNKDVDISEEDLEYILSVLNGEGWLINNTKTYCDYVFEMPDASVDYSTESGLFDDLENDRHLIVSDEQRARINSILDKLSTPPR